MNNSITTFLSIFTPMVVNRMVSCILSVTILLTFTVIPSPVYGQWAKYYIDNNLDYVYDLFVADMDGDDTLDVVAAGYNADDVVWYEGPLWNKHYIDSNLNGAVGVFVADMDGDGTLDVVAAGASSDEVVWYKGPLWSKHVIDSDLGGAIGIYVADIDSDNDLDVVAVGWEADDVVLYDNLIKQVYPKSMQCHPRFIPPQGDTLIINAQIYNPENHPVKVYTIIQGVQNTLEDSLQLFDDGKHSDSVASDNIWGNSKWLSDLPEDIFTIGISTYDLVENFPYDIPPIPRFTTIGPVVFDHFEFTSTDTIPNPGDQIGIRIFLRNKGSNKTASNITAKLTPLDPGVTVRTVPPLLSYVKYGDIGAGEISESQANYLISFKGPFDENVYNVPFALDIRSGDYSYWIDTTSIIVDIEQQKEKPIPKDFTLSQNHPNPFNPVTVINYQLPMTSNVELSIYNLLGQKVATLVNERKRAGHHQVEWDASGFASGIYLYRLEAEGYVEMKKMVLMR